MLHWLQLLYVLCLVSLAQCQPNTTESFAHSAVLDIGQVITVYWNFNDTSITFEIHGHTQGWVGIGFSPTGSMANADIIVGWVKNGVAKLTDRHGGSFNGYPSKDTVQNVELLEGMEVDGYTVIKFRRLLATCDSKDIHITADTMKLIYAWGVDDPTGDDLGFGDQHEATNRGVKSMFMLNQAGSDQTRFPAGETHLQFDLANDNFHVPAEDTYYSCRLLKIPDMSQKHHLVKVEPLIQNGNELNVHHILVYHCPDDSNQTLVNVSARCYSSNMPEDFYHCAFPIVAWAIGGGSFHFPKHAGYALGTSGAPKYVVVETHYDNPELKSDIVDSSGLRFYYTPDLRTHDTGILKVGHSVSGFTDIIPPNAESFLDFGECTENCFGSHMEAEGQDSLNVFAVILHSHLLGRELTLKHVRNGTELPHLAKDASYDFNFQETRFLSEERVLKQGDSMQTVCNYSSVGKSNVTLGGLSTSNEMCLSYVYYYPKIPLVVCETEALLSELLQYFGIETVRNGGGSPLDGIKNLIVVTPSEYTNQTVFEVLNSINWNETLADDFSSAAESMTRTQICHSFGGSPPDVEGTWPALTIDHPYEEPSPNCSQAPTVPPTETVADDIAENSVLDPVTTIDTFIQNQEETTSSAATFNFMRSFVIVIVLAVFLNVKGV